MLRPRSLVRLWRPTRVTSPDISERVSSAARPRGESVGLRLPTGGESLLRVVPILACCVVRVPVHGLERALRMKLGGRRDLDRTAQHRSAQPLNPGPRHQSARST